MITHLTDPAAFVDESLVVEGDAYRHLFRSRRLALSAELRVVDGRGHARAGVVESVSKKQAVVSLGEALPSREPALHLELLVGALRPERADFLVEKATELGVAAIRFLRTERTPRRYGEGRLDRLARVASSAVEQCHRSRLPEISLHDWMEVPGLLGSFDSTFVLAPGDDTNFEVATAGRVSVLVGPEGGFSDDEVAELRELGAASVDLGERILRVETAALASASILLLP